MKRLVDVLIVFVLLAVGAIVVVFLVSRSGKDDTPSAQTGPIPSAVPSTDGTPSNFELPRLTDNQLQDLLTTLDEIPADLRSKTEAKHYIPSSDITHDVLNRDWPEAAVRFDQIVQAYNWQDGAGVRYSTCHLQQPVALISAEVDQLASTAAAQAYIDDPLVRTFYRGTGFNLQDSPTLHGFVALSSSPTNKECYAKENTAMLLFDYWGLMFSITVDFRDTADPAAMVDLLNSLVPPMLARVNGVAKTSVPPTVVPSGSPQALTAAMQLGDLTRLMPRLDELDQSLTSTYSTNSQVGKTYTLEQYVAAYQDLKYPALADALAQAGGRYDMIGQEVRFWDTGGGCPNIVGMSLEVDIALFGTPAGAHDYMLDPALQEAWQSTGLMSRYQQVGDNVLMFGQVSGHHCGAMQVVGKMTTYERLLITVVVNSYQEVDQQKVIDIVNGFSDGVLGLMFMKKLP